MGIKCLCGGEADKDGVCNKCNAILRTGNNLIDYDSAGNRKCESCGAPKSREIDKDPGNPKSKKINLCFYCYHRQHRFNQDLRNWPPEQIHRAIALDKFYLENIYNGEWELRKTENEEIFKRELDKYPIY